MTSISNPLMFSESAILENWKVSPLESVCTKIALKRGDSSEEMVEVTELV